MNTNSRQYQLSEINDRFTQVNSFSFVKYRMNFEQFYNTL